MKLPADDLDKKIYAVFTTGDNFMQQLKCEQGNDPVIRDATDKLLRGIKIETGRLRHVQKQLRIENDILTKNGRLIIPKALRPFIVQELHKGIHPGGENLYKLIQTRFYWPNLFRYVRNHIKVCETCQQCKPGVRPPKAPLLPISEPELPMQFITIDIAYMVKDDNGNKYMLIIGDLFLSILKPSLSVVRLPKRYVTLCLIIGF